MKYSIYELSTGKILRTLDCPEYLIHEQLSTGESAIEGGYPDDLFFIKDTQVFEFPNKPSACHVWNWSTHQWEYDQSLFLGKKLEAKQKITEARNTAESQGFSAFGKVFDSDASSIQRISLAVQAAQAVGESFSIEWTCQDNSTITLDYSMMQALPAFMAQAGNALHVKARALKDQIDAAETLEEIEAIVW